MLLGKGEGDSMAQLMLLAGVTAAVVVVAHSVLKGRDNPPVRA